MSYRRAATIDPLCASAHYNLGYLLSKSGDDAGAEAAYRAAMSADMQYVRAPYNLAELLVNRMDFVGAEAAYRAAITADPTFEPAIRGLATVQFILHSPELVAALRGDGH